MRRILPQYLLLALAWGSSFFLVYLALGGLSPAQVVLARLVLGALALLLLCALTRQRLPRQLLAWDHLLVVGLFLCVLPFLLFAWAQQWLPSSVASILNATTPLMTTLVTLVALRAERPNAAMLGGLRIGFAGVALVLAPWQGGGGTHPGAALACLAGTASYGIGMVYLRRFVSPLGLRPLPTAAVQVSLAATLVLVLSPVLARGPVSLTANVILSALALGVLGTGLAYAWNAAIVASWGATAASTVTYAAPLVGVALGVLVLREPLGWHQPLGALVVIAGILVSQGRTPHPRRTGASPGHPGNAPRPPPATRRWARGRQH